MIKSIEEILGKEKLLKRFKQVEDEMMSIQLENTTKSNELDRRKAILKEIELKMEYLKLFDFYIVKNLLDIEITNIEYSKVKNKFTIKNYPDANISELLQRGYLIDLLNEYVGPDTESYSINLKEAAKFLKRILTKGDYKSKSAELKAVNKILGIEIKSKYSKTDAMILNKNVLNLDYSERQRLILSTLGEYGDSKNPVVRNNKAETLKITKKGLACNPEDKVLFDYLLGQFVENGATLTKVLLRAELLRGLVMKNGKGINFEPIKDSISNLGTQFIRIDDTTATDKASKRIKKAISENGREKIKDRGVQLLQTEWITVDGELGIEFTIPLINMFCSHNQYARLIKGEAIKHWKRNPRIYWICRELGILSRNNNNIITLEQFLKNIGEWERYKSYSNKRDYLKKFNNDFNKALSYMNTEYNYLYSGCTPTTIKECRIKYDRPIGENKKKQIQGRKVIRSR